MESIQCECSAQVFFERLASSSESYHDQSFVPSLDGTIVNLTRPPKFKLWCRNNRGCIPIVSGRVEEESGKITIHWSSRLPLPMSVGYFLVSLLMLRLALDLPLAGIVCLCLLGSLIYLSRTTKEKIEHVIRRAASAR